MLDGSRPILTFLLTPLREGRPSTAPARPAHSYFYSRPCGRGDRADRPICAGDYISTHAPAGGATDVSGPIKHWVNQFLLTPLREGRRLPRNPRYPRSPISTHAPAGGATGAAAQRKRRIRYFYSRPCGRGEVLRQIKLLRNCIFLLTPLREGRRTAPSLCRRPRLYFYSRPCGRGDGRALA